MAKEEIQETNEEQLKNEEKPSRAVKPSWIKMKSSELEQIVVELAKQGETPAKIGLILRDKHGIPKTKLFGKRIREILEEKGIKYKTEKEIIEEKIARLKEHIAKNKCDYGSSRSLTKKLWVVYNYNKKASKSIY